MKISLNNIFHRNEIFIVSRFFFLGLISNSLIYLIYLSITFFGMEHKLAMTILYGIGTLLSYLGNKTWTFRYKGKISSSFIKFILLYLVGYLINLSLLYYFVDLLDYPHQIVQICSVILIAIFLFLMSRLFVFPIKNGD